MGQVSHGETWQPNHGTQTRPPVVPTFTVAFLVGRVTLLKFDCRKNVGTLIRASLLEDLEGSSPLDHPPEWNAIPSKFGGGGCDQ